VPFALDCAIPQLHHFSVVRSELVNALFQWRLNLDALVYEAFQLVIVVALGYVAMQQIFDRHRGYLGLLQ